MTATDGLLTAAGELTVTVSPANTAPVVNAGADQTITLPATATLTATVADDGLPTTLGSVSVQWTVVAGPGTATFGNASTAATTVSFSQAGDYMLRLTATDGELTAADELAITVSPANTAPVVDAGADQVITLPATATLTATVSDDGLPTIPGSVNVQWEVVAGPGEVMFDEPTSGITLAAFPTAGNYRLRLIATDGEVESSDELTVIVTQNSPANPVGLLIEAETGWISNPMLVSTNPGSVGVSEAACYISTLTAGQGTASYGFDVQEAGRYYVWARVLAGDTTNNSFYVSGDGTLAGVLSADAAASGTNTWHWVRLTVGSGPPGGIAPRYSTHPSQPSSVTFETGAHQLTVRGGGAGVLLDKFIVTNDPNFAPAAMVAVPTAPRILDLAYSAEGAHLKWNTVAGAAYRLVYKDNLTDSQWLPASPDVLAFGDQLAWFDETAGATSRRFYSVLVVR